MNKVIENIPFITEEEIRKTIEKVKSKNENFACFFNYKIDEEMKKNLEAEGFLVDFFTINTGFYLVWKQKEG